MIVAGSSLFFNIRYIFNIARNFRQMKNKYQKSQNSKKRKKRDYKKKLHKISKKNKIESGVLTAINESKSEKSKISKYMPVIDLDQDDDFIPPDWDDLTKKDKLKLFNTWSLIVIFGCIFLIMGSLFLITNTRSISFTGELFLGLGSMLTWFSFLRYYQNTKGFNIISNTIENSFEIVVKALAGIMPIFIGFGLLGTCLFWRSYRFTDLSTSMFTLFATMNGDMIWDVWHDIDSINFLLAQLFLYSFILLSICLIFNVFIVIIEDGYIMQKFFARTDWVRGVNQRTSLHRAEHMIKGHGNRELNKHTDNLIPPVPGYQDIHDMSHSHFAESAPAQNPNKMDIPMLNGAPLPHDGDPFIRIIKKSKKDIKSRKALVQMLRHEKIEILNARQALKLYQMGENERSSSQQVRRSQDRDISIELKEEERKDEESPFVKMSSNPNDNMTPEQIAMQIQDLVTRFQNQYNESVENIPVGHPNYEQLVENEKQKYQMNADFIKKTLGDLTLD
uniref:Polycystin cation channel PKD1/PKD2 domain-containing protein n=1 Tax=Euplotes crassus TaxID=5936 RepID=A0A7S3P0P5_EUPCR|mmetsp:Transcript_5079/g.4865  ORF Transcript_5079/g.4865 Transcript_5079/m.4865 type:complete len:505 (+) Transcript_5079:850-2364(+)